MTEPLTLAPSTISAGWTAESKYFISFRISTRVVTGLYGAQIAFEDVVHSNEDIESHYLGEIEKDIYDAIAESISNPISLAFWMSDNTLKVRKIMVDFGPNTYLDGKRNAIVGIDNVVTLIPTCKDQHGNMWNDVTEVQIKNMQKLEFPVSINGQPDGDYKGTSVAGQPVTLKLNKRGRATMRFKIVIPELDGLWLSVYPELYAYDAEGLAGLAAWAATQ